MLPGYTTWTVFYKLPLIFFLVSSASMTEAEQEVNVSSLLTAELVRDSRVLLHVASHLNLFNLMTVRWLFLDFVTLWEVPTAQF